ncbi:MAG TPA: DUF1501 domain-containing protein [Gemmataceae bacterium]|nr:DUF1501 domain-containing protein [Gemmataceae bacterium]
MLHIPDPLTRRGASRREWLRLGGLGLLGLTLPTVLRAQPTTKRPKSVVLFILHGGPSQLDIWDMKPAVPPEIRGEFRPISTSVPGVQITEHLPRLAKLAHRFTIVRSMTHTSLFHNSATYYVTTGQPPLRDLIAFTPTENDFPHLGAQVAYGLKKQGDVPTAVSLPDPVSDGPYTTPGQNGGFLGAACSPFQVRGDPNDPHFSVEGLGADCEPERFQARKTLLQRIDETLGRLGDSHAYAQMDQFQKRALALLTSDRVRQAFELSRESAALRESYGRHKYGQSLLLARRLIEAGVRLVTVYWGGKVNNPNPFWDTHFKNNPRLKEELLPPFDQCFSALLEDLHSRGLLRDTLVVCMGEFGRTPRFGQNTGNGVDSTGRDHWSQCYSLVLAGGEVDGGRVLGRSDHIAAYPADSPFVPQDLTTTLLHHVGVNPEQRIRDGFGRSMPLGIGRYCRDFFG